MNPHPDQPSPLPSPIKGEGIGDKGEGTPVRIRAATHDDVPAINDIYNFHVLHGTGTFDTEPVPLEQRRRWFEVHGEAYPVLVGETGLEVVGWASLSPYHARPAYQYTVENSVYVREDWRGKGIGASLMRPLMEHAEQLGYHSIMALIGDAGNEASIRLHVRLGFVHVGVEREVGYKFDRWLDVVLMQWLIPAAR